MTPSALQVAPPVPAWLDGVIDPEYQVRWLGPSGELHWESNVGPQTWALLCPYDEILFGGRRGGGKSQGLIAWSGMGDPSLPADDPAHYSFLNDPTYRCLLLRDEYQSMAEFVDEAMDFYRNWDCKPKDDPVVFQFKSGAKIYTNHLGNKDAYNKYRGWNLTRIGIEELTQIPEMRWYLKLFGSLRSKTGAAGMRAQRGGHFPKLRTQIMGTANPDGPGAGWVGDRFVKVVDGAGKRIPPNTGMKDEITGLTRIFIPAKLEDNPYLRDDTKYMGMLLSQDEVTRAQWIDGDWDAGTGLYFRDYRPDGPRGTEEADKYPYANHRVEAAKLQPWWYRWGSGDWGYDHPAVWHKFCRNESDKRIHVYDELSVRQVGSFEIGVMLANWWLPDLEMLPDKQVTLYLSPDAFSKTDATKTKAEQIETGIKQVLGPYGAFLLKYNDDERAAMTRDPKAAAIMFERRKEEMAGRGVLCIALKPANTDRVAGWSYLRDLLRFRPVRSETEAEIKERLQGLFQRAGVEAYERELALSNTRKPEVLPGILIWKVCRSLDRFLRQAQRDDPPRNEDVRKYDAEEGVGGDDGGDSCRHGVMAYKEIATRIPKSYWVADRVTSVIEAHSEAFGEELTDPTRLAMIRATQAARYDKANVAPGGGSFSMPRQSSGRHRVQ